MIPEAAVEAAAKAIYEDGWLGPPFWESLGDDNHAKVQVIAAARLALEAAAPHMRFTSDLAGAAEADRQLVRDISGVDQATAESLGY